MASLIVGGVTVPVANDGAKETPTYLRDMTRAQDGSLRAVILGAAVKRTLSITCQIMPDATAATLRAALETTTLPVTCSGDLLGGSVSCMPTLTDYSAVNVRGQLYRRVAFTLEEV